MSFNPNDGIDYTETLKRLFEIENPEDAEMTFFVSQFDDGGDWHVSFRIEERFKSEEDAAKKVDRFRAIIGNALNDLLAKRKQAEH